VEELEGRICPARPPNIILINTDDQRPETLPFMRTTMQELVDSGTTFENNFVSTALCCPSRASLLTGEYAHNHGVLGNDPPYGGFFNFDDSSTLATWLHDAGYHTGLYGKYLNGYGWYYLHSSFESYIPPGWDEWHAFSGATKYYNYKLNDNGVKDVYGSAPADYSTDVLAAKATSFLQNATSQTSPEQPFFLYFAPFAPHDNNNNNPPTPSLGYIGSLAGLAPSRPPNFNEADTSDKPSWVRNAGLLDTTTIGSIDTYRQAQLEVLQSVDDAVASFVATLRATGAYDNTVILYTSDNGLEWGEHRLDESKASPYDESHRVPLIIHDGRHPVQQTVSGMSMNIDLAPTIMDLAGLPIPASVDGRSLVPLLHGQTAGWRTEVLFENWAGAGPPQFTALRTDQWKYVEYGDGERELYNLVKDPYELQNLQADPSQAGLMAQLSARLHALLSSDTQGPVTLNVVISTSLISKGSLTVTVTGSDVATGGSNVRTPELFIDQIGPDFTGTPLIIAGYPNAKLDSPTETFTRVLGARRIAGLSGGVHTIYIHDRDVAGNWGAYATVTFVKKLTPSQAFVDKAYRDLLGREADPAGRAGWSIMIDQGASRADVVRAIENSSEYRGIVVQQLYTTFLQRSADPNGLAAGVAFLARGGTREQLASVLLGSAEYFRTEGGGTNEGFLNALYLETVARQADPASLAAWERALAAGESRDQIALAVVSSEEFHIDVVVQAYKQYLHRLPGLGERQNWVQFLNGNQSDPRIDDAVVAGFLASDEYFALV
jgi:arylsulfatase A-like enzyme